MVRNQAPNASQPTNLDTLTTPAPPSAQSLEGMKENDEIEIVHPKTQETYGVTVKAFQELYEPAGFVPTRQGDGSLLPGDKRAPEVETGPDPLGPQSSEE